MAGLSTQRDGGIAPDERAGIIEQFAVNGPIGLTSYLGWDPARLRYGNFVAAMAMIRRDRLLAAGGYSLDPRLHGWEDFALWCAFAESEWSGVRGPEILGRYRVVGHSMIAVTNIDDSDVWTALARRHPFLIADADEPIARVASPSGAASLASS